MRCSWSKTEEEESKQKTFNEKEWLQQVRRKAPQRCCVDVFACKIVMTTRLPARSALFYITLRRAVRMLVWSCSFCILNLSSILIGGDRDLKFQIEISIFTGHPNVFVSCLIPSHHSASTINNHNSILHLVCRSQRVCSVCADATL